MSFKARLDFNRPYLIDMGLVFCAFLFSAVLAARLVAEPMLQSSGYWANLHQNLFQATLVFSYLTLFQKNHFRSLWLSLVIGYILQRNLIFDEVLHQFFIDYKVYQNFLVPSFSGNPQFSKLLLFIPALCLQIIQLILLKADKVRRFLNFLYILIALLITLLNHFIFPSGMMKDLLRTRLDQLSRIEVYDESSFKNYCIQINARCRMLNSDGLIVLNNPSFDLEDEAIEKLETLSESLPKKIIQSSLETNVLKGVYVVKQKADGSFFEMFDYDFVFQVWSNVLGHFSRNSFFVIWLWQIFLFSMLFIHSVPRLTRE